MRSVQPPVPLPSYLRPTPSDLPTPAYPWRGRTGRTVHPSTDGLGGCLHGIFFLSANVALPSSLDEMAPTP
jgi:hypothetical protein